MNIARRISGTVRSTLLATASVAAMTAAGAVQADEGVSRVHEMVVTAQRLAPQQAELALRIESAAYEARQRLNDEIRRDLDAAHRYRLTLSGLDPDSRG